MASSMTFSCPHCQQPIEWPDPPPTGFLSCPACGGALVVDQEPSARVSQGLIDDELDGSRIKQLSRARRAAIRSRSYAIIAAVLCAVAILQLAFLAWKDFSDGLGFVRPIAYAILACGAFYGSIHFTVRARQIRRELSATGLELPGSPPDFSTLQDGSQRIDQLNQMR